MGGEVPELPDVEGFRRTFARHAAGKRVHGVRGVDRTLLRNSSASGLGRVLGGRRFGQPRRHGKLLVCPTDGPALVLHFGMTGALVWSRDAHPHDRLVLELDDGELHYRNMRRFGGIWLARDARELERIEGRLGPDWLDVSRARFDELLAGRRRSIKAALMDQTLAAGLGNLTADEALWQARIDPRRPVASLADRERGALYRKIQKVLRDSLPHGRVPDKRTWLTGARSRKDAGCPRCGAPLERVKVGGRTTFLCPREQA
jgi:formamidopyrimidine-DNA glycosylase